MTTVDRTAEPDDVFEERIAPFEPERHTSSPAPVRPLPPGCTRTEP